MPLAITYYRATDTSDEAMNTLRHAHGMDGNDCYLISGTTPEGVLTRIFQSEHINPYPGLSLEEAAEKHLAELLAEHEPPTGTEEPSIDKYFLALSGTYHNPVCSRLSESTQGLALTLEQIREASGGKAKPCASCHPPTLPENI